MNWIGGHLQQTKRQYGHITAKQRSYFAKSHKRVLAGKFKSSVRSFANQSPLHPYYEDKTNQELEPPEWLPRELWNSFLQTQLPNEENSAETETAGYNESKKRRYDYIAPVNDVSRGHSEHSGIPQISEELQDEIKRQNLLLRKDWFITNDLSRSKPSATSYHKSRLGKRRKLRQEDHARAALVYKAPANKSGLAVGIGDRLLQPSQISVRLGSQIHGTQKTRLSDTELPTNILPSCSEIAAGSYDPYIPSRRSAQVPGRVSVSTAASFQALEELATPSSIHAEQSAQKLQIENWISTSASKATRARRVGSPESKHIRATASFDGRPCTLPDSSASSHKAWSIEVNWQGERDDCSSNELIAEDDYCSSRLARRRAYLRQAKGEHTMEEIASESSRAELETEQEHVNTEEPHDSILAPISGPFNEERPILINPAEDNTTHTSTFTWSTSEQPSPQRSCHLSIISPNGATRVENDQRSDGTSAYDHRENEVERQLLLKHQPYSCHLDDLATENIPDNNTISHASRNTSEEHQLCSQAKDRPLIEALVDSQQPISKAINDKLPALSDLLHTSFETPITQQRTETLRPWTPVKAAISRRLPSKSDGVSDAATINLVPKFLQAASMFTQTTSRHELQTNPIPSGQPSGYAEHQRDDRDTKSTAQRIEVSTDRLLSRPAAFVKPKRFEADVSSKMRIGGMIILRKKHISRGNYSWHFDPELSKWKSMAERTEDGYLDRDDIED